MAAAILALTRQGPRKRRFSLVLTGGRSPRRLYRLLARPPYRQQVPWSRVHVFWGDERFVPLEHPESNFRLAWRTFLRKVPIPLGNIHPVPTRLSTVEQAAGSYERALRAHFRGQEFPRFDLILLGVGKDGHVASLFPGDGVLRENRRWVAAVRRSPKPPPRRVTFTLPVLNRARHVFVLMPNREKARLADRPAARGAARSPVQRLRPAGGKLTYWTVSR